MNIYKYYYCLGHQPLTGLSEILNTQHLDDYILSDDGICLFTNQLFDIQVLGSVRYCVENILRDKTLNEMLSYIQDETKNAENKIKRVGVIISKNAHPQVMRSLKTVLKHVSLIGSEHDFNFGHWKSTKNWYIVKKQTGELWKVVSVFDQQFWAELDTSLPHTDMKRGIINLKLARTLGSLATQEVCWDPFCGLGRVVAANLDKGKKWFASDIDDLTKQVKQNIIKTKYLFSEKKGLQLQDVLQNVFENNAEKFDSIPEDLNLLETSIVTEGYLGKNFQHRPTADEIIEQLVAVRDMWDQVLFQSQKHKLPELIICLPYYRITKNMNEYKNSDLFTIESDCIIPKFYLFLAKKYGYKAELIDGTKSYLLYARPDSFVGHCIVRLTHS